MGKQDKKPIEDIEVSLTADYNISDEVNSSTSTGDFEQYGTPELIDAIVGMESLTLVYRQQPNYTTSHEHSFLGFNYMNSPQIYKIVFSVKKKKWHQSEKIYGRYIHPSGEGYEFDN